MRLTVYFVLAVARRGYVRRQRRPHRRHRLRKNRQRPTRRPRRAEFPWRIIRFRKGTLIRAAY
jgi:hypothetical protein